MKKIIAIFTVLAITILVASTFLEKIYGTLFAAEYIYHSVWFALFWIALAILIIIYLIKNKLYKKWILTLLYSSVILIVAGLVVTTFTSQTGSLTLEEGKSTSTFRESGKDSIQQALPFQVRLDTFEVVTYPGTISPQDFVSDVTFCDDNGSTHAADISMNHIARHKGYRFYQSGYNPAGHVTLTVTHDPWGIGLTYAGYLLVLVSALLYLISPSGRFRELLKKIAQPRAALFIALLTLGALPLQANTSHPRTLPKATAEKMGEMYVLYQDRVCPLQTLARDFTTKLYGAPTYKGLTSEQVLSGWIFYFSDWRKEPMFKIKGEEVQNTLGIDGKYACLLDFTDEIGQYRLNAALDSLPIRDPQRRDFLAADEKYNLIIMLYSGELLKIFPVADTTGTLHWYSQSSSLPLNIDDKEYAFIRYYISFSQEIVMRRDYAALDLLWERTLVYQEHNAKDQLPGRVKSKAERFYNQFSAVKPVAMGCIVAGLIFFIYALYCIGGSRPYSRRWKIIGLLALAVLSLYLLALFVLRWYVSGHVPMANGYETMLFLALCIVLIGLAIGRRHPLFVSGGLLLSGFALLVAMMGGSNPSITHLMPVLASPLLSIHVAVIMAAYALLAFIMLNGIAATVIDIRSRFGKKQPADEILQRLQQNGQLMLYPAALLLTAGIIIGAVWANISWGTYWSWDPKEVWALITLIVYLLPLHPNLFPIFNRTRFFHLYTILAFLSVLFTYFGVNFLLGGMHSYA